ncbi:MAG: hypothetical protein RR857_04790 [Comamonas sp.]
MSAIGVTSHSRRGYVALYRGYVATFRGYVARQARNPLSALGFSARFCPLPSFYLSFTGRGLWVSVVSDPSSPVVPSSSRRGISLMTPKGKIAMRKATARKAILATLASSMATANAGGVAGNGGGTEVTQLLNNVELIQQSA